MNTYQTNIVSNYMARKFSKYIPTPIRLCKLSKENPNLRLSFCINKGLLYAISLIGEYKGFHSKKSSYKRGIDYLYYVLNKDSRIKNHVSKTEIRRLIYPSNKRRHCLKIPLNTIPILETIVSYVDNPSDNTCRSKCREMRQFRCKLNGITSLDCYGYLIKELREQLFLLRDGLEDNADLRKIAEYILNVTQTPKCN